MKCLTWLVPGVLAAVFAGQAGAQTCQATTSAFFDHSNECPTNGRENCPTGRLEWLNGWSFNNHSYLVASTYTSVNLYNVDNPAQPVSTYIAGPYSPWGSTEGTPDDDSEQWDAALLDDYQYGVAMFQNFGWVTFKVATNAQGIPTGYTSLQRFRTTISTSNGARFARLFRAADNKVYAAAAYLDQQTRDTTVKLANLSDNPSSIQVVGALPDVWASNPLEVVGTGGGARLLAGSSYYNAVLVYNVATPANPVETTTIPVPNFKAFSVDPAAHRLYALSATLPNNTILVYDITNPDAPSLIQTLNLGGSGYLYVAGAGDLVVAGTPYVTTSLRAFSVAQPTVPVDLPFTAHTNEVLLDLAAVPANGSFVIFRAASSIGSSTLVPGSCLSTAPQAAFTVTGGSNAAQCAGTPTGSSTTVAKQGFPGDAFTIVDQSTGANLISKTLTVTSATDPNQTPLFSATWSPLSGWLPATLNWPAPVAAVPGEYWVTMIATDGLQPSTLTKSVWLCTPAAALAVTVGGAACDPTAGCAGLVGADTVTLDASATTGQPNPYTFVQQLATAVTPYPPQPGSTLSFPLAATVKVGVVASYGFAAPDVGCTDPIFSSLNLAANGTYDECVVGPTITAATVTGGIQVMQGTAVIPDNGVLQRSVLTALSWTGRKAPGVSPQFQWNINPAATITNPTSATASIDTSTLALNTPYTLTLTVTDPANSNAPVTTTTHFTAADSMFDYSIEPASPAAGANTTITLTSLTGSFSEIDVGLPAGLQTCDGRTTVALCSPGLYGNPCTIGAAKTVTFDSSGPFNLTSTGTTSQGSVTGPSKPITITPGSCQAACPTLTASIAGPSSGAVDQKLLFTAQGSGATPASYAWTVDGVSAGNSATLGPSFSTTGTHIVELTITFSGVAAGCPASALSSPKQVTITGGTGGSLTFTSVAPNPANVGDSVTFTFSPALALATDTLTFNFSDGQPVSLSGGGMFGTINTVPHSFATSGVKTVSAAGTINGQAVSGSTTVTVSCAAASPPVANFTFSPAQPRAGQTVQFTDRSTGGPTAWAWTFGDAQPPLVPGGTSNQQSPAYAYATASTYTVTLVASNCKGSSTVSQRITVLPACAQTAPPTANFTWAPQGPLANFPEQQQPYVGQQVTLTDASTGSPTSWHWYDFNELHLDQTVTTPTLTGTWPANLPTGPKNVRMTATNCFGTSAEVKNVVTIYPDVRHVVADFSWGSGTLSTDAPVTLVAAQGADNGDPDTFVWTFDDGSPQQTGSSTTHTFTCAGEHKVTLTASRSNYAAAVATATHTLTITGHQCGPVAVMSVDAAKVPGLNNTSWLTNARIFNPSAQPSQVTLEFLPVNPGSPSGTGAPIQLGPYATWVQDDIVGWAQSQSRIGADITKAALRLTYVNTEDTAPIVVSNTYTSPPSGGGRYGEITPGIPVVPDTTPPVLWITGIRNNGTTTGFRTNYSLINLRNDASVQNLTFTLFDPTGTAIATQQVNLNPLEYRQNSLASLFNGATSATSPDPLALRVKVPTGADVQAYVSVMDNLTGDPVLIPAVPPPSSPIFIPAVGHTPGLNGTVWRADMQITNPDSAAPHTWAVTYTPGGHDTLPIATQKVTLSAQSSARYDDLVSWVYSGLLPADASTSGMVRIAPADGSSVYPIVQARSFNQTANGTFGQNITPITADMGIAAGQSQRLLLTGMSSQDIARTNLGFVNLSDTSRVNFAVTFYDEGGFVLNPPDGQGHPRPYTVSLGVGGWTQDKLENWFNNAGWPPLASNLRSISAVIQVTGGGPGTAYATVIDSQTGDPNFILAQPAAQPTP